MPPPLEIFHETAHVLQRIHERGVTLEQIKFVVTAPDTKQQQYRGDNGGFVYKFTKWIDGKRVVAVAEVNIANAG